MLRVYAITKAGKRISGNISSPKDDRTDVLQYLHETHNSTIDDISSGTGLGYPRTNSLLRSLEKGGLVREITRSRENSRLPDYDYL